MHICTLFISGNLFVKTFFLRIATQIPKWRYIILFWCWIIFHRYLTWDFSEANNFPLTVRVVVNFSEATTKARLWVAMLTDFPPRDEGLYTNRGLRGREAGLRRASLTRSAPFWQQPAMTSPMYVEMLVCHYHFQI